MGCGRGTGEDKTRSSATCTEGSGSKGFFESPASVASCDSPMTRWRYRAAGISPTMHEHTPSPLKVWVIETKKIRDVTRAPSKGPKPGGIRHGLWSGDWRRQKSFLCYDTCTEGRGCKGSFFSTNVVFTKFSKFLDFCQQQIHTPARACTRHPAKHRSKGLTCGLATAEHCLHCYVDHN